MEAYVEALVGSYLTRGGSVFLSPHFKIAWDKETQQGGALPDFVALDFERKEFLVVEVTTASGLEPLFTKIRNRDRHWFPPVRTWLEAVRAIDAEWKPRFLGFIREDRMDAAKAAFLGEESVSFYPLEHALLEYSYSAERGKGLPR